MDSLSSPRPTRKAAGQSRPAISRTWPPPAVDEDVDTEHDRSALAVSRPATLTETADRMTATSTWSGEVDASNIVALELDLAVAIDQLRAGDQLIIDVRELTFIDSAGVGAMLHARARTMRLGISLALAGVTQRTSALLHMLGVTELFSMID